MFETTLTLNTHKRPLTLTLHCSARTVKSPQVKASDVDGYGDYDADLLGELLAAVPVHQSSITSEITPEEFEKNYRWFLS